MFNEDKEFGIRFTAALARAEFSDDDIQKIWNALAKAAGLLENSDQNAAPEQTPEVEYRWDGDVDNPWIWGILGDKVYRWEMRKWNESHWTPGELRDALDYYIVTRAQVQGFGATPLTGGGVA